MVQSSDLFIGYNRYEDKRRMRNGVQVVASDYFIAPTPPLGPIDGLDSTYNFKWTGAPVFL